MRLGSKDEEVDDWAGLGFLGMMVRCSSLSGVMILRRYILASDAQKLRPCSAHVDSEAGMLLEQGRLGSLNVSVIAREFADETCHVLSLDILQTPHFLYVWFLFHRAKVCRI